MAYIPADTKWYLADIVMRNRVDNADRYLVFVNLHLIRADSPEEAYEKALTIGRESELTYTNTDGNNVEVSFRGLRNLYAIHGDLEDGVQILYEEFEDMENNAVERLVSSKEQLRVFEPD